MGAVTQVRVLGGCVGLGIATAVFTVQTAADLNRIFSPAEIAGILSSTSIIGTLPRDQMLEVRKLFGGAFNNELRIMTYVAVGAFAASIATFRKHPRSLQDVKDEQLAAEGEARAIADAKVNKAGDEKTVLGEKVAEKPSQGTIMRGDSSASEDLLRKPESAKSFKD